MNADALTELEVQESHGCQTMEDWKRSPLLADIEFIHDVRKAAVQIYAPTNEPAPATVSVDASPFHALLCRLELEQPKLSEACENARISYDQTAATPLMRGEMYTTPLQIITSVLTTCTTFAPIIWGAMQPTHALEAAVLIWTLGFPGVFLSIAVANYEEKQGKKLLQKKELIIQQAQKACERNTTKIAFVQNALINGTRQNPLGLLETDVTTPRAPKLLQDSTPETALRPGVLALGSC